MLVSSWAQHAKQRFGDQSNEVSHITHQLWPRYDAWRRFDLRAFFRGEVILDIFIMSLSPSGQRRLTLLQPSTGN